MAIDMDGIRSTLNDLIETCKDSEKGYRTAAENVKDPQTRSLFLNYARQRAEFASELQTEIAQIGGEPAKSGSPAGAIHRVWVDLKSALVGNHDHAILEEAERSEDAIVKNYREALSKLSEDLPADLRGVVEMQYRVIERTHGSVRSLRDSSRKAELPMAGLV
ncbi:MAG: PA2169 family four-helix-bundle protein [Bryobacteraceae bacterium]|jgi:uncharacterized protein (TIGR02284 family)